MLQILLWIVHQAASASSSSISSRRWAAMMAEAIAGQAGRFDTLADLDPPNFPGGTALRAPVLRLAMTWYAMRDRLGL